MARAEPCRALLLGKEAEEVNHAEILEVRQGFYWLLQRPSQEKDFQLKCLLSILHLLRPCMECSDFALKALKTLRDFWELLDFPFRHKFLKTKSISSFKMGKKHIRGLQQSAWLLFLPAVFPSHFSTTGICNSFLIPRELLQSLISQTNSKDLSPKTSCSSSACKSLSFLVQTNSVGWLEAMQNQIPSFWHGLSRVRRAKQMTVFRSFLSSYSFSQPHH